MCKKDCASCMMCEVVRSTFNQEVTIEVIVQSDMTVVDPDHEQDGVEFLTDSGRAIFNDDQLLADATEEAHSWKRSDDYLNLDWDGEVTLSASRADFKEVLRKLYDGKGKAKGELEELVEQGKACIDRLNYGRTMNGMEKMSRSDIVALAAEYIEQNRKEFNDEISCSYISNEVGIEFASWVNDDGEFEELVVEEERYEEIADRAANQVDMQWSESVTRHVINMMDPNGTGVATHPMHFNGTYTNNNGTYPLQHKSVMQSLFWLGGSRKQNRKGFLSDCRFTRNDRQLLIDFVRGSWDSLK